MYNFGLGYLGLIPAGVNPTPIPIAVITDVSFDISYDMKELRGQYQVAVDVARGVAKITGKAKNATIMGSILLAALGGATSATGSVSPVTGEAIVIAATNVVSQGAMFKENLGVLDLTTGKWMSRVASAPATGQYSLVETTGTYTFAAADVAHNGMVSYSYTSAAVGKTITLNNQPMGQSTPYVLACYDVYNGKPFGFRFPAAHVPKIGIVMKAEAYTEQDLDFIVAQDPTSSKVLDIYVGE